jgi:hypothetical protein
MVTLPCTPATAGPQLVFCWMSWSTIFCVAGAGGAAEAACGAGEE